MKCCSICDTQIHERFNLCRRCQESTHLPDRLKIKDTLYQDKYLKKEVFLDIPERLAKLFQQGNMGMNKLRAFFCMVRNAYLAKEQSFEMIKPQLWAFQRATEDRTRRNITPESFREFVNYYIQIASKNKEELYGFMELFRSIIAYSK
jgi:CRISPR/Cas system CSM-associated protein Csm2 small subunit